MNARLDNSSSSFIKNPSAVNLHQGELFISKPVQDSSVNMLNEALKSHKKKEESVFTDKRKSSG